MKTDQINVAASAVIRYLEQIDDAKEPGGARQRRSDIGKANGLNRIHFDFTLLHLVTPTHFHMRTRPDADAASDVAVTDAIPQALGEHHTQSL